MALGVEKMSLLGLGGLSLQTIVLVWLLSGTIPVVPAQVGPIAEPPLRIGAFNVQIFGTTKMSLQVVQEYLPYIVTRYDILLIQEIRDATGTAIIDLLQRVNGLPGYTDAYNMTVSERLGRSSSKEQYAFMYKVSRVSPTGIFQYPDTSDHYERPPYTVKFSAPSQRVPVFAIMAIHTKPDDAVSEISHLPDVYDAVRQTFGLTDVLIAGDFNSGCDYWVPDDHINSAIRTNFKWHIDDFTDSTVGSTDCPYDRLISAGSLSEPANVVAGSAVVFNFTAEYGLTLSEAKAISDHYPVEISLTGQSLSAVQDKVGTNTTFTVSGKPKPDTSVNDIRKIYNDAYTSSLNAIGFRVEVHGIKGSSSYTQLSAHVINEEVADVISALQSLRAVYGALDVEYITDEMMSMVKAFLDTGYPNPATVYGLISSPPTSHVVELACRLKGPYTCSVKVTKQLRA